MKMKRALSVVLSVMLVLSMSAVAFAAAEPVPGNPSPKMDWDVKYKAAKELTAFESPRTDASGDKITSNAHSADFPGIYFYWDDKQKDNGVLLVDPAVFFLFEDCKFTLTAKNSNAYWGYEIKPVDAQKIGNLYAYGIPRNFMYTDKKGKVVKEELKNINMVFIDGNYKPGYFVIGKVFYNELGRVWGTGDSAWDILGKYRESVALPGMYDLVSFNNGYEIGMNKVEIKTYKEAYFGKTITVTENEIPGFFEKNDNISQKVTVKWNTLPTVTFHNQKKWANIEIEKVWLDVDGEPIEDDADLSASFTINGKAANLGSNQVKEGAYTVSELAIAGFSLVGDNDIEVTVAAGGSETVVFTNQEIAPQEAIIKVTKVWLDEDGEVIDDISEFVNTDGDAPVAALTNGYVFGENVVDADTLVEFEEDADALEAWAYTVNDVTVGGKKYDWRSYGFELVEITIDGDNASAVSFIAEGGNEYNIVITNQLVIVGKEEDPIPEEIELDKIPSHSHIALWDAYGIYCLAGNTTDIDTYFVAFADGFFDTYASVKIAYGSGNDFQYKTFTKADCVFEADFAYSAGGGFVPEADYWVCEFNNPWGSGSRHAYLIELIKVDGTVVKNIHKSTPQ